VGELGEILELLHGARNRYRTVRATLRSWHDWELEACAEARSHAEDEDDGDEGRPEGWSRFSERTSRVWLQRPNRVREENGSGRWRTAIEDGTRWWTYDEQGREHSNEGEPEVGTSIAEGARLLFDPAPLIGALRLRLAGEITVAGRPAYRVLGQPRWQGSTWTFFHLGEGDELELAVDRERGVVLRSAARLEGHDFRVVEAVEIAFDEEFPAETFRPIPGAPKGERPEARHVSVDEAAELTSFPLWLPPLPGEGWNVRVLYFPGGEYELEAVLLRLTRREGTHSVTISLTSEEDVFLGLDHRDEDWEVVERAGHEVHVMPAQEQRGMQAAVRLERGGTWITLVSESLREDSLLEIVDTLTRHKPRAGGASAQPR